MDMEPGTSVVGVCLGHLLDHCSPEQLIAWKGYCCDSPGDLNLVLVTEKRAIRVRFSWEDIEDLMVQFRHSGGYDDDDDHEPPIDVEIKKTKRMKRR